MENLTLNLPFKNFVMRAESCDGHEFVAVAIDNPVHPFAVYELGIKTQDGRECLGLSNGYCETRAEAFKRLEAEIESERLAQSAIKVLDQMIANQILTETA